jgi:hypothetical protein
LNACVRRASTWEGAVEYEIDLFFNIEKPKQGWPYLQLNKIICSKCYFTQELNFIQCGMNYNQYEVTTDLSIFAIKKTNIYIIQIIRSTVSIQDLKPFYIHKFQNGVYYSGIDV